jgi:hypothetical protein
VIARAVALSWALAALLVVRGCCPYGLDCLDDGCNDPTDDDAAGDDDAGGAPVSYHLEVVAQVPLPELDGVRAGLVGAANEFTYLLDGDGTTVRYLTDAYVHPTGDFCLGAPPGDTECENGTTWTSGRIETTTPVATLCQDRERGQLFLIKEGATNGKVEVVDTHPGGDKAYSYNRAVDVVQLPQEMTAEGWFVGPCVYVPGAGALIMTSPDQGQVARFDIGVTTWISAPLGSPTALTLLQDGETLVLDRPSEDSLVLVSAADLSEMGSIPAGGKLHRYAVDRRSGRAWVAHGGDGGAHVIELTAESPVATPLEIASGEVAHVVADPSSGTAVFAVERDSGGWRLYLVQDDGVADFHDLEEPVIALVPPSEAGDVVALVEEPDGGTRALVLDAVPDGPDGRPPLYGYLFAAIEKPSDSEIDEPCTGDGATFETRLSIIEANAQVLAGLGVPVALGLTYNFAITAERCDRTDIFETLQGHGFELGSMVHNKPCYHCTDQPLGDVPPDECTPGSPLHCDPATEDCCFPGHEEFCPLGDWDCYKAFVDAHNVVVDRNIDGGGAFVVGADRHGLWQWDWARAYQELARSDGGEGYDVAFFAQAWAYADQVSYNDPRSKEPAPWRPADRVESWYLGEYEQWEQDSAFSDLLYLPGLPVSTVKLHEWHSTGLFLVDFFDVASGIQYTEEDFADLTQYLRRSLGLRTEFAPNTWYFHIHELGEVNLADASGTEVESAAMLREWIDMINEDYVSTGVLEWKLPSEIRAEFQP